MGKARIRSSGGRQSQFPMLCLLVVLSLAFPPLTGSAGLLQSTPAPETSATATFTPSADTHVVQDQPTRNLGLSSVLEIDGSPRSEGFVRFDVVNLLYSVERATLRFRVSDGTESAPALWLSPNTTWRDLEVVWNTRPAVDKEIASGGDRVSNESWLEYDVTSVVTGNGSYTFALVPTSDDGLDVNSMNADKDWPELVIDSGQPWVEATPAAVLEAPPVLLAAGDIAGCGHDEDEETARILDEEEGVVAVLGDNVYNEGTVEQFTECYDPTWGRHKERTMPAVGNHEYLTEGAQGYIWYFGPVAGDPQRGYYSNDLGTWHIVVLNTNIDITAESPQLQWLREDLEQNPVACTLAYWHHPRFSSGADHGNDEGIGPIFEVMYEYGVEIVLNGHDHDYERFAPQTPDAERDGEYGVRQFVVGTGGIDLREFGDVQSNSEARNNTVHGVLRLELNPDAYTWEFLPVEGKDYEDSGEGTCHDAPSAGTVNVPIAGLWSSSWIAIAPDRVVTSGKTSSRGASRDPWRPRGC